MSAWELLRWTLPTYGTCCVGDGESNVWAPHCPAWSTATEGNGHAWVVFSRPSRLSVSASVCL